MKIRELGLKVAKYDRYNHGGRNIVHARLETIHEF
jgi:hypothetical protein